MTNKCVTLRIRGCRRTGVGGGRRQNTPKKGRRPLKTKLQPGDLPICFFYGGAYFSSTFKNSLNTGSDSVLTLITVKSSRERTGFLAWRTETQKWLKNPKPGGPTTDGDRRSPSLQCSGIRKPDDWFVFHFHLGVQWRFFFAN